MCIHVAVSKHRYYTICILRERLSRDIPGTVCSTGSKHRVPSPGCTGMSWWDCPGTFPGQCAPQAASIESLVQVVPGCHGGISRECPGTVCSTGSKHRVPSPSCTGMSWWDCPGNVPGQCAPQTASIESLVQVVPGCHGGTVPGHSRDSVLHRQQASSP